MPRSVQSVVVLKGLLEECGYSGARLASGYRVGDVRYPLVGFAGRPWDRRSACIAVVATGGDPAEAAKSCRDLGAPIVWVGKNGTVDWWVQHAEDPTRFDSRPIDQFAKLVRHHKDELAPASVYRAKTLGRLPGARQLAFVDAGLMPLLEAEAGERLGGLVEDMIRAMLGELKLGSPSKPQTRRVFTTVFRLLAGKILKDKGVQDFKDLDLSDPAAVLKAVWRHYNAEGTAPELPGAWGNAIKKVSGLVHGFGNVRAVSPETLAYVYEHTLVNKELRKKLGIHATPPYLVDYIVWQLYDWIREIDPADRHVFEPGCGHAPFLLAAMRMLRMEMEGEPDRRVHAYLQSQIHGVEYDDFAREIARLSLTLADVPNPNGWDLRPDDMYASDVLAVEAKRCRILLSNPPYERFEEAEEKSCREAGFPVRHSKPVELLHRTLPCLAPGAVFGVLMPQNVLHSKQARSIRELLLRDFEIREVCLFADKVFEEGEPETAVLLGRRAPTGKRRSRVLTYRRVREDSIERFAKAYTSDSEYKVPLARFETAPERSFVFADLPEVWDYLRQNPALGTVADVGQGFSFAQEGLIAKAREAGKRRTPDAVPAYLTGVGGLSIWQVPEEVWLSPSRTPVLTWRSGNYTGKPQVLVNYVRVMRGPWRLKALLDPRGHAVSNTYSTVRCRRSGPPEEFLWALLNSPLANAYAHCHTMQKHIYDSLVAAFPLPARWREHVSAVVASANNYLGMVREPDSFKLQGEDDPAACEALLRMDAAVMRAYDLPVRLERAVLDLFRLPPTKKNRRRRKGVGCVFGDYFPADLRSLVPLHKYISVGYRTSSVGEVAARMKPGKSPAVLARLRSAADAFGED